MMKKVLMVSLLSLQAALLIGCSRNPNSIAPNQMVSTPGAALPATGTGAGFSDPYGTGAGYGSTTPTGTGAGYSDPYGAGAGAGYGSTPAYGSTPYGNGCAGMNNGAAYGAAPAYGSPAPAYGAGAGFSDPYGAGAGAGAGYGAAPAYGTPAPMMGCDPGIAQQIINKIQQAGGYKGMKADNVVVDSLKTLSMPIQQAFQAAPLASRVMIIKALLDGWAASDEINYARQIWGTIMPQEQQTLTAQDAELSKLIGKVNGSKSNGVGSVLSEIGKVFSLSK